MATIGSSNSSQCTWNNAWPLSVFPFSIFPLAKNFRRISLKSVEFHSSTLDRTV